MCSCLFYIFYHIKTGAGGGGGVAFEITLSHFKIIKQYLALICRNEQIM